MGCHAVFDFLGQIGKHHCKMCGQVFCSNCSRHQALVQDGGDPERVCDRCNAVSLAVEESSKTKPRAAGDGLHRTRSAIEYQFVECYENQQCAWGAKVDPARENFRPLDSGRRPPYTRDDGSKYQAPFSPASHPDLEWQTRVDEATTDEEGWEYAFSFMTPWGPAIKTAIPKTWVRRRKLYAPSAGRLPAAPDQEVELRADADSPREENWLSKQMGKKYRQVKTQVEISEAESRSDLQRDRMPSSSSSLGRLDSGQSIGSESGSFALMGPLSTLAHHALIREAIRLLDFDSQHCSVRQLLDHGVKVAFTEEGTVDNPVTLQLIEAIEDTIDRAGHQLTAETVHAWVTEVMEGVKPKIREVRFCRVAAQCRAIVSAAAAKQAGDESFAGINSEVVGPLLRRGLVRGQGRALQLLFLKNIVDEVGTQEAFRRMKQPEFPQELIADLSQELRGVGSSDEGAADYKPSFDPLLGLANADLQVEITQTIVFNHSLTGTDAAANEGRRELLGLLRQKSAVPELVMAAFHNVFLLTQRGFPPQVDSIVSGLSMSRDEARLLKFLASSGGDTASKFLPQIGERTTLDDVLILRPIVHLAAVCLAEGGRSSGGSFLAEILTRPQTFADRLLPAMPEDEMAAIYATLGDVAIYKCPNGHPYAVANCTRTDQPGKCSECGAPIGNAAGHRSHTLAAGNTLVGYTRKDRVNQGQRAHDLQLRGVDGESIVGGVHLDGSAPPAKGYDLNPPDTDAEKLSSVSVRELTPASTRVMRYILHGLLLLSHGVRFDEKRSEQGTARLLKSKAGSEAEEQVRKFILGHLRTDFDVLRKLFTCNAEDLSVRLHLYIDRFRAVADRTPREDDHIAKRNSFEAWFQKNVIEHVNRSAATAVSQVKSNASARGNAAPILQEVEEVPSVLELAAYQDRNKAMPLLLMLRKRPSYQAMIEQFDAEPADTQYNHPLLELFRDQNELLRVHRHMFAVCRWLKLVRARYNKKISRDDAEKMPVQRALEGVDADHREEWDQAWIDFREGWNAIK
eukprot:COSAG04_NODE_1042_length_8586_cov_1.813833_3_plen_1024_part_01